MKQLNNLRIQIGGLYKMNLKEQITKHKIEEWLKSSHTEEVDIDNVIEMIYDIATGGYSVERLRKDIKK